MNKYTVGLIFFIIVLISCSDKNTYTEYYSNGNLKLSGEIVSKKREGIWKRFNEKGDLIRKAYYKNDSVYLKEDFMNGKLTLSVEFKNGKPNGLSKEYFESGNVKSFSNHFNGKQLGESVSFYSNGNIRNKTMFLDDGTIGEYEQYYPTGELNVKADNLTNGIATVFDKDGVKMHDIKFEHLRPVDTLFRHPRADIILKEQMADCY